MADQNFARYEAEYCPPLDPPLLYSMLSDYNLDDERQVQAVRAILDKIKADALVEEAIGFDASGTGGVQNTPFEDERRGESLPDTSGGSFSRDTDLTSESTGMLPLDLENDIDNHDVVVSGAENAEHLESLDEDTKVKLLEDIFGKHVNQYGIRYTLHKCNGVWNAAMEALLNYVYLAEAATSEDGGKIAVKSVDAFAEDGVVKRGRKGKAKNKNKNKRLMEFDGRRSSSLPVSPVSPDSDLTPQSNRWNSAGRDIDFVVKRTGLPSASVSSAYYQSGANLSKAIGALLKSHINDKATIEGDDETVIANARELGLEFPNIAPNYLTALIRLSYPSTASAHELARALTRPNRDAQPVGLQIITNYQPPAGVETEVAMRPGSKQSRNGGAIGESAFSDHADIVARAREYSVNRNMAYAQAQAAYRRAKSDRLMGGAAAYYGQLSRDFAALSFQTRAVGADGLADIQSSATHLDLHGIDVANAVRIASDKVQQWWQGLGESRVNGRLGAGDRRSGFNIIVGLGKHSEGGKSKIGPAVKKMLREGGWRFEDGGAAILVKGRVKT